MVVGVCNNDVILGIDSHTRRFGELALQDSEFSKLAMVDHLLAFDLRFWRENWLRHQLVGEVHDGFASGSKLATHG